MSVNFKTEGGDVVLGVSISEVESTSIIIPPMEPSEPVLISPTPLGMLEIA